MGTSLRRIHTRMLGLAACQVEKLNSATQGTFSMFLSHSSGTALRRSRLKAHILLSHGRPRLSLTPFVGSILQDRRYGTMVYHNFK